MYLQPGLTIISEILTQKACFPIILNIKTAFFCGTRWITFSAQIMCNPALDRWTYELFLKNSKALLLQQMIHVSNKEQ